MFVSFFPRPKLFFLSAILWAAAASIAWLFFFRDLGSTFGIGFLFGFGFPTPLPEGADEAARAAFDSANGFAADIWTYEYMIVSLALFCLFWGWASPHRWYRWSVVASVVIVFVTWFQVQVDVMINDWFGRFYDLIQQALGEAGSVRPEALYGEIGVFFTIAMVAITVAVLTHFLTSHYVFRWRTAMNDYYVANWDRLRHIEGAAQRVQEDTMRFANIMETLGVRLIDSVMTLLAFLPILWGLSVHVKELPIIGEIPHALVIVAITWSALGTGLLALAGIRLPGLEFRNQRVEAAYRKELVLGEDNADRAQPPTLASLFEHVRRNYYRIYWNYLYFNVVRYGYLQAGAMVPYVALAPTILAGGFTLGVMQQIIRAFGRVESSFQFLVNSWVTIVELISIYKRLKAFEATLDNTPLPDIENEAMPGPA